MKENSESRKAMQESIDRALQGDAEKAVQKEDEATEHVKKAAGKAAEAGIEGTQIVGTSTAGPIGLEVGDAVVGIATGAAVEAQKKEIERMKERREREEREKREKALAKRCGEGITGTDGRGECANVQ